MPHPLHGTTSVVRLPAVFNAIIASFLMGDTRVARLKQARTWLPRALFCSGRMAEERAFAGICLYFLGSGSPYSRHR